MARERKIYSNDSRLRISGFLLKDIYVPSEDQIGQQVLNHGYYTVAFTVYVSTRLSSYSSRDSLASALLNFDEYTVRDDQGNYYLISGAGTQNSTNEDAPFYDKKVSLLPKEKGVNIIFKCSVIPWLEKDKPYLKFGYNSTQKLPSNVIEVFDMMLSLACQDSSQRNEVNFNLFLEEILSNEPINLGVVSQTQSDELLQKARDLKIEKVGDQEGWRYLPAAGGFVILTDNPNSKSNTDSKKELPTSKFAQKFHSIDMFGNYKTLPLQVSLMEKHARKMVGGGMDIEDLMLDFTSVGMSMEDAITLTLHTYMLPWTSAMASYTDYWNKLNYYPYTINSLFIKVITTGMKENPFFTITDDEKTQVFESMDLQYSTDINKILK